ncbi:methyltransferase [Candidatus Heimdallarchaeota archaeon]|nr:MAG: methyltransferase [Candidatus Gerdarchaeota archaeon]RLI71175.1 MAG: methyltransferase [Candidatus Gerdarchaeota archaeon]RLI72534.1 MAG: methyltransferase [Candidatus Heimdallarchaeota archaeon]
MLRVKRKDLEIFLTQIESSPQPKLEYEQYPTPARVAANLLWIAGVENNDLYDKIVADLGCGTGILSIGAAFLGARTVIGIDIDFDSLIIAKQNSLQTALASNCFWICMRVEECHLKDIDTVVMNPPFGMRKESHFRDRDFLEKALTIAKTIYSINPSAEKTREFFRRFCKERNARVDTITQMSFDLAPIYPFHKKRKHLFIVDLYKILKE